ncbi:hypothetical protein GCM10017673_35140 [Streptosporangium violaceochromogenes]|nr:hypothetical protein GCM10017673_35140 [Streptosporangium violaceochromogenes]
MTTATAATPGRAAGRPAHVDALRGFALLGILIVNVGYLASTYHGTGLEDPGFASPLDNAVRWFVAVFFEAKFFLLFSFLFGYSFTLQLSSAGRHGVRFAPRFLRRLAGLFVLGTLHAVLLFPGDILTTYAILGLILLAARRLRPRTAVRTAVTLFVLTAGRQQALGDVARHHRTLGRLQWAGFMLGLLGGVVYAHASLRHPGGAYQILALGIDVITAPLLAAAYAATVLRLACDRHGDRLIAVLGPAGRMTLTNYLTQSLVCSLLFTGYGAALVGDVPPLGVLAIALVLFTAQALASRRWMRRYRYGPLEWLLRAWTALTWPPLRRGENAPR